MLFNFTNKELLEKINTSQWIKDSYDNMKVLCEPLMKAERPYAIVDKGARGAAARSYGARMAMLITAGMEEQTYIDKAIDMLMYAVETADIDYYEDLNGHLAVADGAFTYAVCYDLLKEHLDDSQKMKIKEAMLDLAVYLYECDTTWGMPHSGVSSCNHNSVHLGNNIFERDLRGTRCGL